MDDLLKEKIRKFIAQGIEEKPMEAKPDSLWTGLKNTGTELWLDTGDMEEAEKIWTAEMTALTTNNTLVNKEIQRNCKITSFVRTNCGNCFYPQRPPRIADCEEIQRIGKCRTSYGNGE